VKEALDLTYKLRKFASAIPQTAPGIAKMNQIWSAEVMPFITMSQKAGEPAAPPGA